MPKTLLSLCAIALTFYAFLPYIRSIRRHDTKPHVFSWLIWGTTTFIVFLAQLEDQGGAGAWPLGVSAAITIYIAGLAYVNKADSTITRSDGLFFGAALSAVPLWYWSADPLWAVVILTLVDLLGFGPTFRKAYHHPFEEQPGFFALFMLRNILVIASLEHYSITTVLFPAAIASACLMLIPVIRYRRQQVSV